MILRSKQILVPALGAENIRYCHYAVLILGIGQEIDTWYTLYLVYYDTNVLLPIGLCLIGPWLIR